MFFMSCLPENQPPLDEGKERISGRKREFLSGLLGEENNNLSLLGKIQSQVTESIAQSNSKQGIPPSSTAEHNSRRSSITESLKEFESSLLDMLQDAGEEEEDPRPGIQMEIQRFLPSLKIQEVQLTSFKEDKDGDYILTPLEEEDFWSVNNLLTNSDKNVKKIDRCKIIHLNENRGDSGYDKQSEFDERNNENKGSHDKGFFEEKHPDKLTKHEPPSITIETVS